MPGLLFQNRLLETVQSWSPPGGEALARLFSALGGEYLYLLLIPALLWFAPWGMAVRAARAMVLVDLLGEWIKWTLLWPRPEAPFALAQEPSPGFVSTHAAISIAVAGLVGGEKPKLRPFLALWVVGVGWSRLRLGVHFPIDVLGGWLLGALVAAALWRWGGDSPRTTYGVVALTLIVAALWPEGGAESLQRDLGLLFGLEFGLLQRHRGGQASPAEPLPPGQGALRLLLLLFSYFGLKALGWPRLLRYLVLALIASWRAAPKRNSKELS